MSDKIFLEPVTNHDRFYLSETYYNIEYNVYSA